MVTGESPPAPHWIPTVFGAGLVEGASRLGWGFRNETWKVRLADGRSIVVTRLADAEEAASVISLTTLMQPRLRAVGVPAPAPIDLGPRSPTGLLVSEFIAGTPGAEILGEEDGPAIVGSVLGACWRRLASIDPVGLPLPDAWAPPDSLVAASEARLGRVRQHLSGAEHRRLRSEVATLGSLLEDRQPGFVHGDLVPVNILVVERKLAALLDLEFARLADPLLDAGWFRCIVDFHHPSEAAAAWRAFTEAADLDDAEPVSRDLLRVLPSMRLLEILDDDRLTAAQVAHWTRILRKHLGRPT